MSTKKKPVPSLRRKWLTKPEMMWYLNISDTTFEDAMSGVRKTSLNKKEYWSLEDIDSKLEANAKTA